MTNFLYKHKTKRKLKVPSIAVENKILQQLDLEIFQSFDKLKSILQDDEEIRKLMTAVIDKNSLYQNNSNRSRNLNNPHRDLSEAVLIRHIFRLHRISRWYSKEVIDLFAEKLGKTIDEIAIFFQKEKQHVKDIMDERTELLKRQEAGKNPISWILHLRTLDMTNFYLAIPFNSKFLGLFNRIIQQNQLKKRHSEHTTKFSVL